MRGREINVPGLLVAALLSLVGTALTMADLQRYDKLALVIFCFAWLVFYVSVAMPFKVKKRERN